MDYIIICAVCEKRAIVDQVKFKQMVVDQDIEVIDSPKADAVGLCTIDKQYSFI